MRLHWSAHIITAFGIVGSALYFSNPANASPQPDPIVANYAFAIEDVVCSGLAHDPTIGEVDIIVRSALIALPLTPSQDGEAIAMAVGDGCPKYLPLLISAARAHGVGANGGTNA